MRAKTVTEAASLLAPLRPWQAIAEGKTEGLSIYPCAKAQLSLWQNFARMQLSVPVLFGKWLQKNGIKLRLSSKNA